MSVSPNLITENSHAADGKYQLNLSATTNDLTVGFFHTGIIKEQHRLIPGEKTNAR